MDAEEINLGYLKDCHPLALKRWNFPSKVGGAPAWLDPRHLPAEKDVSCGRCGRVMTFLLQVYCPIDAVKDAFHRMLYLFCCLTCNDEFKVLRCQLPLENDFYAPFPLPDNKMNPIDPFLYQHLTHHKVEDCSKCEAEEGKDKEEEKEGETKIKKEQLTDVCIRLVHDERKLQECLCMGCGLPSEQGSLKDISSEEKKDVESLFLRLKTKKVEEIDDNEEANDWLERCPKAHQRCMIGLKHGSPLLRFPEFELDCAEEESEEKAKQKKSGKDGDKKEEEKGEEKKEKSTEKEGEEQEVELLKKYEEVKKQEKPEEEMDESEVQAFEEIHEKYTTVDPQLEYFLKRTEEAKSVTDAFFGPRSHHILRYGLGGEALYPFSYKMKQTKDVPKCEKCGADRQFEMQVQPAFIQVLLDCYKKHDGNQHVFDDLSNNLNVRDITDNQAIIEGINRLEFGLIAVFTCSKNCKESTKDAKSSYIAEYLHVQKDPLSLIGQSKD